MKHHSGSSLSRRDFVKYSAMTAAAFSLPVPTAQASLLPGNSPKIDYNKDIKLINCNLVDVKTGEIIPDATIHIRDGRIVSAGKTPGEVADGCETLDLKGRYVIPGLINGHLHMTLPPASAFRIGMIFPFYSLLKGSFTQSIEGGVTTARDMAAIAPLLHYFMDSVAGGSLIGPRIVHSNIWLGVEGGYLDLKPGDVTKLLDMLLVAVGPLTILIEDVAKQEELLRKNIASASYIKLSSFDNKSLIAGKQDITLATFSDAQLKAIFDFAARNERPVAAHIMTAYGFRRAMQYPVSYMEHIVSDVVLNDAEIKAMADRHVTIVPTMVLGNLYAFDEAFPDFPPQYKNDFVENEVKIRREYWNAVSSKDMFPAVHAANNDALGYFKKENYDWKAMVRNNEYTLNPIPFLDMLTNGRENLRKMKAAGVTIGCGTDSGVPMNYHGTLWREMEILSRLGFSNLEVLQAATLVNARICLMEDKIGTLEPGKYADVVVLKDNPLTTITAYRQPLLVFKDGRLQVQKTGIQRLKSGLTLVA